jgi:hypothetical protein
VGELKRKDHAAPREQRYRHADLQVPPFREAMTHDGGYDADLTESF